MRTHEEVKTRILGLVAEAKDQRIRPITLEQTLQREIGSSVQDVKHALSELSREGKVVYSYRDPCSYVELPALESPRSV